MERCLQTQELPPITDNLITLFYFFDEKIDFESLNKKHDFNESGLNELGVPDTITEAIKKRLNTDPLWKEIKYNISKDLSPVIHNLFHAEGEKAITTWQLEGGVRKLLSGKTIRNLNDISSTISLQIKTSAQERIASCSETDTIPQIEFENITCHQFKTGFSVAVIELRICNTNPSHTLLNEAVYSLTRFNDLTWKNDKTEKNQEASLGEIIRALFKKYSKEKISRAYTHSYIQVQGDCAEKDFTRNLKKLAKHYNDEYHITNEASSLEIIRDYKNITHCVTLEGASSGVIITESSPEFLTDYKTKIIKQVHIPLHLLAFHTEKSLQQFIQKNTFWINTTEDAIDTSSQDELLSELQKQQLQLSNFNLNFFQPVISNIGTHNQLSQYLNKVKQLDKLHEKTSSNNQVISKLITERIKQQKDETSNLANTKYCKIAKWGVAAAAYITSFTIIKEALDVIKEETSTGKHSVQEKAEQLGLFTHEFWTDKSHFSFPDIFIQHIGATSLVLSTIIMLLVWRKASNQCNKSNAIHEHDPASLAEESVHLTHLSRHSNKSH